ncbi:MAG: YihY/virulence factor BrkB family protein [Verrucomicrobiaceae bacterium]|nr:MAG: YihY/virulence factor BrkB family protein [Verrucomicrobiaceae bacterium]
MNLESIVRNRWIALFKQTGMEWVDDKASRLSAALAYYSIFSIAPLLVIAISIAGQVLGQDAVSGQLYEELRNHVGPAAADTLQSMIKSAYRPGEGAWAAMIGFGTLLLGASGVFGQLKDALNTIWNVETKTGKGVRGFVVGKLLSFGMVLVIGFLLLVSLMASTTVSALNHRLESQLLLPSFVWVYVTFFISWGMVTTLFALIFKILPDIHVAWRAAWMGAALSGLLFEIGKTGLGWYLGRESMASAYGAAGSIVLLLLWIYYTSCILFFGAEFAQVYVEHGKRHASHVKKPAVPAVLPGDGF